MFAEAGWTKARLRDELHALPAARRRRVVRGAGGIAEGMPEGLAGVTLPKFRPTAACCSSTPAAAPGLFSAIIGGWVNGPGGSAAGHPGGEAVSATS